MKMMTRLPFPAPSRLLLAGAVLLALSACASVGRYPIKEPDVAASYGRGDATLNAPADDPRSSLDTPGRDIRQDTWWTGFGDERLDIRLPEAHAARDLRVLRRRALLDHPADLRLATAESLRDVAHKEKLLHCSNSP